MGFKEESDTIEKNKQIISQKLKQHIFINNNIKNVFKVGNILRYKIDFILKTNICLFCPHYHITALTFQLEHKRVIM